MEPMPGGNGPALYALLIGVDFYMQNRLPDGGSYHSLRGCVRDIDETEAFLERALGIPADRILKLAASDYGGTEPFEPREEWPTYENMVAALQEVTRRARPGDRVYIHYSGHGGRAPTIVPRVKGEKGIDEALVPTDIGHATARYLRDVELAKLFKDMVDKGLIVAVVLDSCHSGGMTRGRSDAAVRGIASIDTTPRPTESAVGAAEDLGELWNEMTAGGTRDAGLGSGWLPEPRGYTLLAACRSNEYAYESGFGGGRHGALTYWLLDSLQDIGPGLSYKVLHDRIVAKIHSQFEKQTPQLQGEGDRAVFGSDRVRPHYQVGVLKVETDRQRVLLNAGQSQMLRQGAQFAIYPHGTTNFSELGNRQALVELSDVGATESWARIVERFTDQEIEQGAQAVLLGAPAVRLVRKVSLVRREDLPAALDQDAALEAVRQAIPAGEDLAVGGWVELATDTAEVAYQVAVNEAGEYEIWDQGGEPVQNLRPPIQVGAPHAARALVNRLEHLSRYHALRQLRNHDPLSPLARKLEVELTGRQAAYDPADPFEPEALDEPGGTPALTVGEWVGVRIKNASPRALNVTVFDLMPGWKAAQIYPPGAGDAFVTFEPGQEIVLPLQTSLPAQYEQGTDVIKVFATVGATDFHWLELPRLDQPHTRGAITRSTMSLLDRLVDAMAAQRPHTRDLTVAAYPSKEWVAEQVEIHIRKAGA